MLAAQNIYSQILYVNRDSSNLILSTALNVCGSSMIPSFFYTDGVNADTIIFVNAFNATGSQPSAGILAYGLLCYQSIKNYRPLVGQIQFNLAYITDQSANFYNDVMTAIHELNHVLAFNSELYPNFLNSNGYMKQLSEVVQTINFGGTKRLSIVTPKVLEVAREHYNCPTLLGVPLENDGSSVSAGAHWEKTFFHNDFMIADDADNIIVSKISLALFEDSGWYGVDYSYADEMFWGKNQGCTFLDLNCKTDAVNFGQFCRQKYYDFCTFDYTAQGVCFPETFLKKDGCLDAVRYKSCYDYSWNNDSEPYDPQTAAKYGVNSKCFMSNILNLDLGFKSTKNYSLTAFRSQCYEYYCSNNNLYIIIANQKLQCGSYGQIVSLNQPNSFNGSIICPDPSEFCQQADNICPSACTGQGYCHQGKCICYDSTKVFDCSLTQDEYNNLFLPKLASISPVVNMIASPVSQNMQVTNSDNLYSLEFAKSAYQFSYKLQTSYIFLGIIILLLMFF